MSLKLTNGDETCVADSTQGNQDQALAVIAKPNLKQSPSPRSLIGKALFVKGDIGAKEDIQINGKVEGTIAVKNNCVEIGASGHINANVFAKVVIISGEVKGDVYASEQIVVTKTGRVYGNIHASDVSIEDGALLKGSIDMEKQDIFKQHVGPDMHEDNHKLSAFNFLFRKHKETSNFDSTAQKDIDASDNTSEEIAALAHECSNQSVSFADCSIIGESVMIKGEVISEEDVVIQGAVDGTIYFKNNSLGSGPHSLINANIFVKSMIAHGEIKGDIFASEQVILKKPGHVTGTIHSPRISIESGAVLMGGIEMEQQDIDKMFKAMIGSADGNDSAKPAEQPEASNHSDEQAPVQANKQNPVQQKEAGWPIFYPRS